MQIEFLFSLGTNSSSYYFKDTLTHDFLKFIFAIAFQIIQTLGGIMLVNFWLIGFSISSYELCVSFMHSFMVYQHWLLIGYHKSGDSLEAGSNQRTWEKPLQTQGNCGTVSKYTDSNRIVSRYWPRNPGVLSWWCGSAEILFWNITAKRWICLR